MRDGQRRLRAALWAAVAVGIIAAISPKLTVPRFPAASAAPGRSVATPAHGNGASAASSALGSRKAAGPVHRSSAAASGAAQAGTFVPTLFSSAVRVAKLAPRPGPAVAPLRRLLAADLLVVAPQALPRTAIAAVRRLVGVTAAESLDAARIKLNGGFLALIGVDPSRFRAFAARPTAQSTALWQNVANGGIAVSYLMGQQQKLPLGGTVQVAGARTELLRVGGFGTVGISGVDAVVSDQVARSLGVPAGNAIVISAPHARLSVLIGQLKLIMPKDASVAPLVAQAAVRGLAVSTGSAGGISIGAANGPGLTPAQTQTFLTAALSRIGLPYVWGGSGPDVFDCSGLVQWSMRQAGIVMPRVAADQARTGPLIPLSQLQPGDLLFYHTDPTAPSYISHVAIYLGSGMMLQAPEPGMNVEKVPAVFDGGFAGAVRVYPRMAATVAGQF